MITQRVVPLMQFCVLCDAVVGSRNGKMSFVGVFDSVKGPKITIPQFSVVTGWTNGLGKHHIRVRLLSPLLSELVPPMEAEVNLKFRVQFARLHMNLVNFTFQEKGVHWIEVSANDEIVASVPLPVGRKT